MKDSKYEIISKLAKGYLFFLLFALIPVVLSLIYLSSTEKIIFDNISQITDFWGLILGLPVSAAGAIVAILLAQRAIEISDLQVKQGSDTLLVAQKISEMDIRIAVSEKWDVLSGKYHHLFHLLNKLSIDLNKLNEWHLEKKNYLSYDGVEASLVAKGEIESSLNELKGDLSINELYELVCESFNMVNPNSINADNESLSFSTKTNINDAKIDIENYVLLVTVGLSNTLKEVANTLREIGNNSFASKLWKMQFSEIHNNSFFAYNEAINLLKGSSHLGEYTLLRGKRFQKGNDIYSSPLKLAYVFNELSENVCSPDYIYKLFFVSKSNNSISTINLMGLLDLHTPFLSLEDKVLQPEASQIIQPFVVESGDKGSPVQLDYRNFWNGLEPQEFLYSSNYACIGKLLVTDMLRLIPSINNLQTYIKSQYDVGEHISVNISESIFTEVKELFHGLEYLELPFSEHSFIDTKVDATDEFKESLLNTIFSDDFQTFASKSYAEFLNQTIHDFRSSHVNRGRSLSTLTKLSRDLNWEGRVPVNAEEESIVEWYKELDGAIQSTYVDYDSEEFAIGVLGEERHEIFLASIEQAHEDENIAYVTTSNLVSDRKKYECTQNRLLELYYEQVRLERQLETSEDNLQLQGELKEINSLVYGAEQELYVVPVE